MNDEWLCFNCHENVMSEYYMVTNKIWNEWGCGEGMLCVGCLETRMNRQLTPADFPQLPINHTVLWHKSDRLLNRIWGE